MCWLKMPTVFPDIWPSGIPEKGDKALYPGSSISVLAIWIPIWCPSRRTLSTWLFNSSNVCSASYFLREQICHRPSVLFQRGILTAWKQMGEENLTPILPQPLPSFSCWVQIRFAVCVVSEDVTVRKLYILMRESPCVGKISRSRHITGFK